MFDELFQRNASKFPILLEYKNTCSFPYLGLSLDQTRAFMTENNAVEKNGKKIFYLFGTILCQTTMKKEHLCFRIPKLWQSLKRFIRTFQQA